MVILIWCIMNPHNASKNPLASKFTSAEFGKAHTPFNKSCRESCPVGRLVIHAASKIRETIQVIL